MYIDVHWSSIAFCPIILLLLRISLSAQATVRCGPSKATTRLDEPNPEDCRFLLAHLPSNPLTPDPETSPQFSLSLPFQPRAYISHASCSAELTWFIHGYRDAAPQLPAFYSAPPVVEIYELMRDGGERVITGCLESGEFIAGMAWGSMRGNMNWQMRIEPRTRDTWWKALLGVLRKRMSGRMVRMLPMPDPWGSVVLEV